MPLSLLFGALIAPAIWNGYPLLQYDTGGYLARWYEPYLVPSRSTAYGIYLHLGAGWHFWPIIAAQSALAVFVIDRLLRHMDIRAWTSRLLIIAALIATTALPFLSSMLLTDIFVGLSVIAFYLLIASRNTLSTPDRIVLFITIALATSFHSATFAVIGGLCLVAWIAALFAHRRLNLRGIAQSTCALVLGAALLFAGNAALGGKWAWTPGGASLLFGRMMQDGIVKSYLDAHCAAIKYKLCPYKDQLPATADGFLWGEGIFNDLGRFAGLGDEMAAIAIGSLKEYPARQAETLARATAQQFAMVATGEGMHNWIWHTYGIIHHFLPGEVAAMDKARQQAGELSFDAINEIHVPVALISSALLLAALAGAIRKRWNDIALLSATVTLAMFGNALICGGLSGPHDRYGARIVWIVTLTVLIAALRWFTAEAPRALRAARQKVEDAGFVDLVADRAHMVAPRNVEHL